MSLESLVQVAATLAILAIASGHLPAILRGVRMAQIHLIQDSQASKWGRPLLLPNVEK